MDKPLSTTDNNTLHGSSDVPLSVSCFTPIFNKQMGVWGLGVRG